MLDALAHEVGNGFAAIVRSLGQALAKRPLGAREFALDFQKLLLFRRLNILG